MFDDRVRKRVFRARRGTLAMSGHLAALADRIEARTGIRPLWIEADRIAFPGSDARRRPRVQVITDSTAEYLTFRATDGVNFDHDSQAAIASDLLDLTTAAQRKTLFAAPPSMDLSSDVLVTFTDFEEEAVEQAHNAVTLAAVDKLGRRHLGADYWKSMRFSGPPVLFVQTDAQVTHFRDSPEVAALTADYAALVQRHDEFDLVDLAAIELKVDSKEKFENFYQGSSYYYFR